MARTQQDAAREDLIADLQEINGQIQEFPALHAERRAIYRRLSREHGLTQKEIAALVGMSETAITNDLRRNPEQGGSPT